SQYMYVVGADSTPGNLQWRIEKRSLTTGAFIAGFGAGGAVANNPSTGADEARAIAIDSSYMYVVGVDYVTGNARWRIEKRSLTTGVLVGGFGTGGAVVVNPSAWADEPRAIAIASPYIYVAGIDYNTSGGNAQWRIEKRSSSTGALVGGFGTGGVVTYNPSTGPDETRGIAIGSSYMYVVGFDNTLANSRWNIQKRYLSNGALVTSFGTSGVVTYNPSTGPDEARGIAIGSSYMYVVGFDNTLANSRWNIQKRSLSNGALVTSFGTSGVVTTNPSSGADEARAIAIDSTYMYVVGFDNQLGNPQWRMEKRFLGSGTLATTFGTGGVVTTNPSAGADEARAIAADTLYMYVVGVDYVAVNGRWRIEKRAK
ncbi:MAG: hypothetical protein QME51_09650, partial [Planctomycetota bacterium]|nr:hypothetical protein [Planctomycetota bacterium]